MPITVSCNCGKVFRVKDEMAGRVVTCQICGNMLTAPEVEQIYSAPVEAPRQVYAEEMAPEPAPPERTTKTCPACSEEIPKGARVCPHCGEQLANLISAEDQSARLEKLVTRLDAHVGDAAERMDDESLKGGFLSAKSIVGILITAVGLAMIFSGLTSRTRDAKVLVVFGIIIGVIAGICLLVSLVNDSNAAKIGTASAPDEACLRYMNAIKTGRAKKAFVALAPTARTAGRVNTITFKDKDIPAHSGLYSIKDLKSFTEYWKSIFTGPSGQTRTIKVSVRSVQSLPDDMALVELKFQATNYPAAIAIAVLFGVIGIIIAVILWLALRHREEQVIRKLMIKRNGTWYVAESALTGPLDSLAI